MRTLTYIITFCFIIYFKKVVHKVSVLVSIFCKHILRITFHTLHYKGEDGLIILFVIKQ